MYESEVRDFIVLYLIILGIVFGIYLILLEKYEK